MDTKKSFSSVEQLIVDGWPEDEHFEPHGIHHWVHANSKITFVLNFYAAISATW